MKKFTTSIVSAFLVVALSLFAGVASADNSTSLKLKADDIVTTSKIESKFLRDGLVSATKIIVSSRDGHVVLEGLVDSYSEYTRAITLATSVENVKDVDAQNLKVRSSKQLGKDIAITAKVKGKFIQHQLFKDEDINLRKINVETQNGNVYLTGTVSNKAQRDNLVRIAKGVSGVKSVNAKNTHIQ